MLQSDLHNVQNQKKMKLEEFINLYKNMKDVNQLSDDFLKQCYANIQNEEIKAWRNFQVERNYNQIIWNYFHAHRELFQKSRSLDFIYSELSQVSEEESK